MNEGKYQRPFLLIQYISLNLQGALIHRIIVLLNEQMLALPGV